MTSLIKKQNDYYFCSNCRIIINPEEGMPFLCRFCGAIFSNWESTMLQMIEEEQANEDNIHGRN